MSRNFWAGLGLVLAISFAFGASLGHDFVDFDDNILVYENPNIRQGFTFAGLKWAFAADLLIDSPHADYWQPLTFVSRMIDIQLFELNSFGHHLTNVMLHAANTLFLFFILRQMTGSFWRSLIVAAVFGLHPLRVESVAWVTERKDVLSAFFGFGTIWAYHQYSAAPGQKKLIVVCLWHSLGLLSKPILVTVPILLVLLDYWPLRRPHFVWWKSSLEKWPLFALSLASGLITLSTQSSVLKDAPMFSQASAAAVSYIWYVWKFFWPVDLVVFYPPVPARPEWQGYASILAILAVTASAVFIGRRLRPYVLVGWLWFLVLLLPVVRMTAVEVTDRFTYLPHIGLGVAVIWWVGEWLSGQSRAIRVLSILATIFLLAIWTGMTRRQVEVWRDTERLFQHAVAVSPGNWLAHNMLGHEHLKACDPAAASEHFSEAIRILPEYAAARYNLGVALLLQKKHVEAEKQFSEILRYNPSHAGAHYRLGVEMSRQGKFDRASAHFTEALKVNPSLEAARRGLESLPRRPG